MQCNSCNQPYNQFYNDSGSQNNSLSDFFPAGYRIESGYPRYPYYVSVPVFVDEEDNGDNNNDDYGNCCHCCHCCYCCQNDRPCPRSAQRDSSGGYNRIRCTTQFCR